MQDGRALPAPQRGRGRQPPPLLGLPQLLGDPPLPDLGRRPQDHLLVEAGKGIVPPIGNGGKRTFNVFVLPVGSVQRRGRAGR